MTNLFKEEVFVNRVVHAVFGNDFLFFLHYKGLNFTYIILFFQCYETKLNFSLKLNASKTLHQYFIFDSFKPLIS